MSDQESATKFWATPDESVEKVVNRQRTIKQTELSQASSYTGSCDDMCPERERSSRLGQRTSIFERDPITNVADEFAMVKEYRRAGADQEEPLPDDLRTPKALENTVDYLISNIMDDQRSKSIDYALEWYDFLWDRLRAVRKDITQQNICNELSAILVERCTRFHIHSCYALNGVKNFDVNMNKKNLNDCLQMLRQIYQDLKDSTHTYCNGEFEFKKYNILLHFGEDALTTNLLMKEADNRSIQEARFMTDLFNSYTNNNYYKFFKLMQKADYMTSCILSLYVNNLRLAAMKIILAACTSKQAILYPANMLIESLGFDDIDDLTAFASHFEIDINFKDSQHYLVLKKEHLDAIRKLGSCLPPVKSRRLVENKMDGQNVGQLVYGQTNVTPYVNQTNRTNWYDNNKQLTNRNSSVLFKAPVDRIPSVPWKRTEQVENRINNSGLKRKRSTKQSDSTGMIHKVIKTSPVQVEEVTVDEKDDKESRIVATLPKCSRISGEKRSNLTTHNIEKEDYGQYYSRTNDSFDKSQSITHMQSEPHNLDEKRQESDQPDHHQNSVHQQSEQTDQNFEDEVDMVAYQENLKMVADMMPAGRLRRSKRLMPKFGPIPKDSKKVGDNTRKLKESKRAKEINSMKECAMDEEKANLEFFRIVRMVI